MKLIATCPTCNAELEVEDIAPGTTIECPACNHALTIPAAPAAKIVGQKKQLRLPSRSAAAAPSSAPVYVPVPAKPRGIIGGAFHGCGVLFVMLLILIAVIVGCNLVVLGGAASAIEHTSAWQVDQQTPGLVNRAAGGSIMITGQGPSIVSILVNDFSPDVLGSRKCEAVLVVDGREVRRDDWIGASGAMLHLDTRDDPRRAQARGGLLERGFGGAQGERSAGGIGAAEHVPPGDRDRREVGEESASAAGGERKRVGAAGEAQQRAGGGAGGGVHG